VDRIVSPGRIFIAISLVVFGIQHFIYANYLAGLVPAWLPGRLFWAYFVGVAFVAAAIGAVDPKMTRTAGILLGMLFLLFVVTLHIPRIAAHSRDGNEWTNGFVALAMCGGRLDSCRSHFIGKRAQIGSFIPQAREIFFLPGHVDIRRSAFHQREIYHSGWPAVVSRAAPLGLSHRHRRRCYWRSDLAPAKSATSRHSSWSNSFSLFSVPSHPSHPGESGRSGPMDERLRSPGPVRKCSHPGKQSAKKFKIAISARSAPDLTESGAIPCPLLLPQCSEAVSREGPDAFTSDCAFSFACAT
jgi:uncharacterized membrane protein YphA (DoxX/SURF4 family)